MGKGTLASVYPKAVPQRLRSVIQQGPPPGGVTRLCRGEEVVPPVSPPTARPPGPPGSAPASGYSSGGWLSRSGQGAPQGGSEYMQRPGGDDLARAEHLLPSRVRAFSFPRPKSSSKVAGAKSDAPSSAHTLATTAAHCIRWNR